jgi:hypothetical protein
MSKYSSGEEFDKVTILDFFNTYWVTFNQPFFLSPLTVITPKSTFRQKIFLLVSLFLAAPNILPLQENLNIRGLKSSER